MVSKGKKTCGKRRKSLFEKLETSSEEDDDEMREKEFNKLLGSDTDEDYDENDREDEIRLLEIKAGQFTEVDEGEFYVVEFPLGTNTTCYYAAKVMEIPETCVTINCLRRSERSSKFTYLDNADICEVAKEELCYKLPHPLAAGQTKRQKGVLVFNVLIPVDIDLR